MNLLRVASIIGLLLVSACGDTKIYNELPTTPTTTNPTPAPPKLNTFEFRVNGNASQVRIVYSTPQDGVVQVITALPYQGSFTAADTSIFLTMDVTAISFPVAVIYPFNTAQILVNGIVFRQASSDTFLSSPMTVSGTWRATN